MPRIVKWERTAYVTGALTCVVAPVTALGYAFVCRPALRIPFVRGLTRFPGRLSGIVVSRCSLW